MGPPGDDRFTAAVAAIDHANGDDPNLIEVDGALRPKEQVHAELMTGWVKHLDPDADESQLLAARAHHLRRWVLARHEYPQGRSGYLRWRAALKRIHVTETAEILGQAGYDASTIQRVGEIIAKERLGTDPQVQTHEDALCLVFLTTQLDDLVDRLGESKAVDVVARSLTKMSVRGRREALALDLSDTAGRVVASAIERG